MNASVLHTTLCVCLALAGGVICKIGGSGADINHLQQGLKNYVAVNKAQHHSFKNENYDHESLRLRCLKNSLKEDAFETIKKEMNGFIGCLDTRNITVIINNLYLEYTYENYGSLLKGLCTKLPDWNYCKQTFNISLMECYNDNEKLFIANLKKMTSVLEVFLCQKNAELITAFFSDGGVTCITNRSTTLGQCFKKLENKIYFRKTSTYEKKFNFDSFMTSFKFNREQCNDLRELQSCLVDDLRHCELPTVSNIVDSGIKLALRHSPCSEFMTAMG